MTEIQQNGIITLIKSALCGQAFSLPEGFDLKETIEYVTKSQITNMIYYGAINCGISQDSEIMQRLFLLVCQILSIDAYQKNEIDKICNAFDENGIDYMPLKGILLKKIYPNSSMRTMGDADILIRNEQYERIKPLLVEMGYKELPESNHELPWSKSKMFLELHKRLISTYNKDFYAYFRDGWGLAKLLPDKSNHYQMREEDTFVYLFTHLVKHYRSGGIGIKHMTDLWVFLKAYPNLDQDYINSVLNKLMLLEFYNNVMKTLKVWFADGEADDKTELITYTIFKSGAYGNYDDRLAALVIRDFKTENKKHNRVREIAEILFPPYKKMCDKYPILHKAAILLPCMWLYRGFAAVFTKPYKIKAVSKNIDIIANDKVSLYHKSLQKVGLDYNFEGH